MNARDWFGVLVRWTGLLIMIMAVTSWAPLVRSLISFVVGACLLLFADAVVKFVYEWPRMLESARRSEPGE